MESSIIYNKKAIAPDTGIVKNHAQKIFLAIFQLIADNLFDRPTPRIAEVMTCEVLVGKPKADAPRITPAAEVWTQKP